MRSRRDSLFFFENSRPSQPTSRDFRSVCLKILIWSILLAAGPVSGFGNGLNLECEIDGKMLPFAAVSADSLFVRVGETLQPVPSRAQWRLSGDLRENAEYLRWAPRLKLEVPPVTEFRGDQKILQAVVTVETNNEENASKFKLIDWPAVSWANSALVAVWMVDGKPEKIEVRPAAFTGTRAWGDKFLMELTPSEARGEPLLMLWADGKFVPPIPEYPDNPTETAFISVLTNNVAGLKNAVGAGAKLKKKSRTGATLAHYAAMADAVDALAYLLQQNPAAARANTAFGNDTPLHWAALTGRVAAARVLLQGGVRQKHLADDGFIIKGRLSSSLAFGDLIAGPLESAVLLGHTEIVRLLLDAGAPVKADHGENPIDTAISHGYPEVAQMLLDAGATQNFKSDSNQRRLESQAETGREPIVRFLLEHGVNPDSAAYSFDSSKPGKTALMAAAESNAPQTVGTLLAHDASLNLRGPNGETALHFAAVANSAGIVKALLDRHADYSIRNNSGLRPLDEALLNDARDAAIALVQAGSHIDVRSANVDALLESALRLDIPELIRSAVADGWNPNAQIESFCPALTLARYFGAKSCESALLASGAVETGEHSFPVAKLNELDSELKPIKSELPKNREILSETLVIRVEFILNSEGKPMFLHVLDSPPRRLASATLRAFNHWVFTKPTVDGKPVHVRLVVPVVFKKSD